MSSTEFHLGKFKKVKIESTLEETCRQIAKEHDIELSEDWREDFEDDFNLWEDLEKQYFFYNDILYKMEEHIEKEDEDYFMDLKNESIKDIVPIMELPFGKYGFSYKIYETEPGVFRVTK